MLKFFGVILRAVSVIWFVFALMRIFLGFTGNSGNDLPIGLITLVFAFATFRFGTWLKNRPVGPPISQAWWAASYGFRLSVFFGLLWAICAYLLQDNRSPNFSFVIVPPFGLVLAYLVYSKFVPIPPTPEFDTHTHNSGIDELFSDAIRSGNTGEMRRMLQSKSISPLGRNKHGRGWLQFATLSGSQETCKLLLQCGASPTDNDDMGASALMHARATGNKELVGLYSDYLKVDGP